MLELLNQVEIKQVVEATEPGEGHASLLAALRKRYPGRSFDLVASRFDRRQDGGLVDQGGQRHAESYKDWMRAEFEAAGENAQKVWEKHKDAGLIFTEWRGHTLYITIPFGPAPEDFYQLEVAVWSEIMIQAAFGFVAPAGLHGLINPFFVNDINKLEVTPPRYLFKRLTNLRQFVKEMEEVEMAKRQRDLPETESKRILVNRAVPGRAELEVQKVPFLQKCPDWLARPMRERRFLQDWRESSAGAGGRTICRHWFLQIEDFRGSEGRQMGFTPQWSDADGGKNLPEIAANHHRSVYGLMEALEDFDRRAGYPFAWFFYMLHRNRMDGDVGEMVAEGVKAERIRLPAVDEKVLLRWHGDQYGF